jgi:hypothetical protein
VQVEWTAQVAEEDVNAGSFVCRVLGEEVMGPSPLSAAPPLALASLAEETEESPSPSCVEFPIARRLLLSPAALPTPVASPPPPQPGTCLRTRPLPSTPVVVKVNSTRLSTCPHRSRVIVVGSMHFG